MEPAIDMTPKEAKENFVRAGDLYLAGRFDEALDLLDKIDQRFPGNKNIMFPRARCLAKLQRNDEAVVVCNLLAEFYDHDRAREFRERILGRGGAASGDTAAFEALNLGGEDDSLPTRGGPARWDGAWATVALVTIIVGLIIAAGYYTLFAA